MTSKEIRDHLGRVKPYYLRNEIVRALAAAISGLQGLGNTPPSTDMRGLIREAVQLLSRDKQVRKYTREGALIYQPGQERAILVQLALAYKGIQAEMAHEDHDATVARKVKLDQAYTQGLRHLEQKRSPEADAAFTEALNSYKDEHRVLFLMGKALMDAGEVRRALPYLKRGVEAEPDNEEVARLYEECCSQREQLKHA